MLAGDGIVCGKRFWDKKGLGVHRKRSSNHMRPTRSLTSLVIANQCPHCETTLATYGSAYQHLWNSCLRKYCVQTCTDYDHKLNGMTNIGCPICLEYSATLQKYNEHCKINHTRHIQIRPKKKLQLLFVSLSISIAPWREALMNTFKGRRIFGHL